MALFRRLAGLFVAILGFVLGLSTVVAVFVARSMIAPVRQRLWATPGDAGLGYEDVQFPAQDGLRVSGWFVPAPESARQDGATIALVHGWGWNRLGTAAESLLSRLSGGMPVEFLRIIHALHGAGYNVLTFDLRNHGQSATSIPVTFGLDEAKDLLGALAYLRGRPEVNADKIGVIGFSMGGNVLLYTLPQTSAVKAAVAIQPTTPGVFSARFAQDLLGPLGKLIGAFSQVLYGIAGGPRLSAVSPAFAVAGAGSVPVLYVQGEGDPYGTVEDVQRMAAMTPNGEEVMVVQSDDRFGGYRYVVDNPQLLCAFFDEKLA